MHEFWLSKGTGRKQSLWSCTDQKEKKEKKRKTFLEKTYSPQKLSPHCTFLKKIHYSQIKNETHDYDSDSITFFQPA